MGPIESFVTLFLFAVGAAMTVGSVFLVLRIAKPALFVMVPILLYFAVVMGAWDGLASDFDATRREVLKHRWANGYALEHMTERGRFRTCHQGIYTAPFYWQNAPEEGSPGIPGAVDNRGIDTGMGISLTDDAQAVCQRAMTVGPGERVPGSEHKCGFLGTSVCFYIGGGGNAAEEKTCYCHGCGCKGGPGWRKPDGQCASHAELTEVCHSPPGPPCKYEGARQVCPPGS
jgi:hypothetical protein